MATPLPLQRTKAVIQECFVSPFCIRFYLHKVICLRSKSAKAFRGGKLIMHDTSESAYICPTALMYGYL